MASALFTSDHKDIILRHPIAKFIDLHRDGLPKDTFDQDMDEGT
jgi:hypothetical protein